MRAWQRSARLRCTGSACAVSQASPHPRANKILEGNGVTYTNNRQTDELAKTLLTIGLPTTYFVDSEGRVLTVPVRGMNFDKYREKIEEALKAVH